jgi:hypothetical protein
MFQAGQGRSATRPILDVYYVAQQIGRTLRVSGWSAG